MYFHQGLVYFRQGVVHFCVEVAYFGAVRSGLTNGATVSHRARSAPSRTTRAAMSGV